MQNNMITDTVKNLLSKLVLEIVLDGSEFDGCLNFGAVEMKYNDQEFTFDVTDTVGYLGETLSVPKPNEYLLVCRFNTDLEDLEDYGTPEHYSQSIMLPTLESAQPDSQDKEHVKNIVSGITNLLLQDEDCREASVKNLERVKSINLIHVDLDNVAIPISQDNDF